MLPDGAVLLPHLGEQGTDGLAVAHNVPAYDEVAEDSFPARTRVRLGGGRECATDSVAADHPSRAEVVLSSLLDRPAG